PTFADRDRQRDELLPILHALFRERTTEEWLTLLNACGVPAGAVNDVATAFKDPQVTARDVLVDVEHPRLGTVPHIPSPLLGDPLPAPIRPAPARGEHTDEVLRDLLAYDEQQISALKSPDHGALDR